MHIHNTILFAWRDFLRFWYHFLYFARVYTCPWRMTHGSSQITSCQWYVHIYVYMETTQWPIINLGKAIHLFAGILCLFDYDSLHILFLPVRYSCNSRYRLKMCMTSLLESSTQKISIWWGQYILSIQWYDKYFNRVWRIPKNRPISYTQICKILFSRYC